MTSKYAGPRWETPDPPRVHGSYGPAIRKWAKAELGITFGRWQTHVIDRAMRHDRAGDLIARIVLLSTARQNGKSVIVRAIFGWFLDEGWKLPAFAAWTTLLAAAHDAKQARITYKGVYGDMMNIPRIASASKGQRTGKPIRLTEHFGITMNGLTLDTVTGQPGSARGLSAGAIAYDEVLTQRDWDMWEALQPTMGAQRSPIIILTSTAGFPDSVILRAFYDRLIRQASGDELPDPTFYGAWWESEDPHAGLDWTAVQQANPALGDGRLTKAAIQGEYAILPPDSWRRERLNHFADIGADSAFNPGVWAACRTPEPLAGLEGPYALAVGVQPGWERATIAVTGVRPDGRIGAEIHRDIRGEITAQRIVAEVAAFRDPVQVIAYDSVSAGAPEFRRDAEETGRPWREFKPADMVAACMDVSEMVLAGRLAHDDPLLDAQIAWTAKRPIGLDGAYRFSVQHSGGPIDAVNAVAMAAHAIASPPKVPQIFF